MSGRSVRSTIALGLVLTAATIVVATIGDTARIGPVVFWAVHRSTDRSGSSVALRPGLGLLLLWAAVAVLAVDAARRRPR